MPNPDYPSVPQSMPEEDLQTVIRRWQNRELREYFSDFGVDNNWDPDLTTPRGKLANVLRHADEDTYMITMLKCWFFEHIKSQTYRVPYYGIPVSSFQESRKFQPQIKLYFQEDLEDVEPGYPPVAGEIGFRLMNYTTTSLTPSAAEILANRVRIAFGDGGRGYLWRKGKDMATYTDWGKGYQLQLLIRSKAEAREVINKVLDIQNDAPDWKKMNYSENEEPMEAYPTIPDREMIYGELRREARRRPVASCRFQYALLHLHGVAAPIVLYDRSYTYSTALVTAN
ncbi:hypothetical protein PGN35_025325 [Nodosilinea sp. PGN35]|uniref:hypothetical protein n=1 Tax=Nodosilinea sp. PGN35 TaxID=3020489 RepID=UPI0023B29E49|nr:hypothetical protein [Nodosilinea sp. TSF1-S3]MDF0367443.1 hypothetical protein [Nodosilinea sp. TSF1-S3]